MQQLQPVVDDLEKLTEVSQKLNPKPTETHEDHSYGLQDPSVYFGNVVDEKVRKRLDNLVCMEELSDETTRTLFDDGATAPVQNIVENDAVNSDNQLNFDADMDDEQNIQEISTQQTSQECIDFQSADNATFTEAQNIILENMDIQAEVVVETSPTKNYDPSELNQNSWRKMKMGIKPDDGPFPKRTRRLKSFDLRSTEKGNMAHYLIPN